MAICRFGKIVKTKLVEIEQKQDWLIREVSKRTGLYFDTSYMHKILTGQSKNPKIVAAIREILDLPEENEDAIANQHHS